MEAAKTLEFCDLNFGVRCLAGQKSIDFMLHGNTGLRPRAGTSQSARCTGLSQRLGPVRALTERGDQNATKSVACAGGVDGGHVKSGLVISFVIGKRQTTVVAQGDHHAGHMDAGQAVGDAATAIGHDGQFTLVHDQHVNQCQQLGWQGLCRSGIKYHFDTLRMSRLGISQHRRHRYFELQQQVGKTIEHGQISSAQCQVGTRRHRNSVFSIVRNADECCARGQVHRAHHLHLDPGRSQGLL